MASVNEPTTHPRRIWILPALLIVTHAAIQAVAFAVLPDRGSDGSVIRGGRVDVSMLQNGDCFDWRTNIATGSIRQVDLKPCNTAHEATHRGKVLYPASTTASWPGFETTDTYGRSACQPLLLDWMMVINIMPTQETWLEGDRTILCIGV